MNKILKIWLMLLGVSALLWGCEKEDNLFKGNDNYITSFILEKNGVEYIGAITGNVIEMSIPYGEELSGFTAKYDICEQAEIAPDPMTITNWNQNLTFTVTAYNNESRSYSYSVKMKEMEPFTGDVVLLTQSDINEFGAKNLQVIEGNLIIGKAENIEEGADTIKTLEPLNSLKKITGSLTFNRTFKEAKSFGGLQNLEHVGELNLGSSASGGTFYFAENNVVAEFGNLKTVTGAVNIVANIAAIKFPKLEEAMTLYIQYANNAEEISFPKLSAINNHFTLKNLSAIQTLSFPALKTVAGNFAMDNCAKVTAVEFPLFESIGRNCSINTMAAMTGIEFESLEIIGGNLEMKTLNALTSIKFPKLKSANKISVTSCNKVAEFQMNSLERVATDMELNKPVVESLSFDNLKKVGGTFKLQQLEQLQSLNTPLFEQAGSIYLYKLSLLTSAEFPKMDTVGKADFITTPLLEKIVAPKRIGTFTLNAGSKVFEIPEITGIESVKDVTLSNFYNTEMEIKGFANIVKGKFYMSNSKLTKFSMPDMESVGTLQLSATNLTSLEMPKLKSAGTIDLFGGNMTTFEFPVLETLGAFLFDLKQTSGTLETFSLPALKTLAKLDLGGVTNDMVIDLPLLTEIKDELIISPQSSYYGKYMGITKLDGLSNITKIGKVKIIDCSKLVDFTGLKNALGSLSADTWNVSGNSYNPTYQDMLDGKYTK